MIQELHVAENWSDENGMPAGGTTSATGLCISWQNGPLGRDGDRLEPNGAFVETIIDAAKRRIEWYQVAANGRFACQENADAIEALSTALRRLNDRTQAREERGVEGTHQE